MIAPQLHLSVEGPKKHLARLEDLLGDRPHPLVCDFGRYLAQCFHTPKTTPMGFALMCELAICDLTMGVTHPAISRALSGQPAGVYHQLHLEISRIADAIFPEEFASAVKSYVEQFEHMIP